MNLYEMIISNINPLPYKYNGYFIRKRIFHKGYEVTVLSNNQHIHLYYIYELEY